MTISRQLLDDKVTELAQRVGIARATIQTGAARNGAGLGLRVPASVDKLAFRQAVNVVFPAHGMDDYRLDGAHHLIRIYDLHVE